MLELSKQSFCSEFIAKSNPEREPIHKVSEVGFNQVVGCASRKSNRMSLVKSDLDRAVRYHQSGKLKEAGEIYERILESDPDHPDVLHLSGVIAHQSGKSGIAIDLINRAIQIDPEQASFYSNLGNALMEKGRLDEALECYQKALEITPNLVEAHYNLGNAFYRKGDFGEAVRSFQKTLELMPELVEAQNNLGNTLVGIGRLDEAVECYQKALEMDPDNADTYNHLGKALKDQGKLDEAILNYQMAIHSSPANAEALNNLGNLFHEQMRLGEAVERYQKALEIKPDYIDAHDNLGKTFRDLGMLNQATSCYKRSLELDPDNGETIFDLATVHLLRGNFAEGWSGYESRFKRKKWRNIYPFRLEMPRWDGAPFAGKRLFVHSEQGFGDSLQFVRYLPMVKERGGEVVFETVKPFMDLFKDLKGVDILLEGPAGTRQAIDCDLYVPLLSLPGIFETRLETIPSRVPYLFAEPRKVRYWHDKLPGTHFKVGLVWTGKATDRRRACPIEELSPLLKIPGVEFVGLQKGAPAKEVSVLPEEMAFRNIGEEFEDFSDTAAAIEHLNLIISIDTSVAHLAGAMGKPAWVLLHMSPDWRWLMNRSDSPWYPTMRLFRQSRPGHWDNAIRRMERELRALVNA